MKMKSMVVKKARAHKWVCLMILVVMACVTAFMVADQCAAAQPTSTHLTDALPGVTNLDVVLVIDQSGSMWVKNDRQIPNPDGSVKTPSSRIVAATMLAEWLATDQSGARHQVSVIMFGATAKVVFPLQEIQSPEAQAAYKKALADGNLAMGSTSILEAIHLAKAELDKGRTGPNDKKALIFLSDGVCEPFGVTTNAQRQQCERDIREFVQQEFGQGKSGPIYTIALTSDAFKQNPANRIFKNLWQEISVTTGGDYYEPVEAGAALLDSFVKILQQLFGLPVQSPPPAVDAPTVMTVTLPNDLLQVGFTLIKYGQGVTMTLTSPDGAVVNPDGSNIRHSMSEWTESYNISRPAGGQWVAGVNGSGKVILLTVPFAPARFTVEHLHPTSAHPQGKPMEIEVRVLNIDQAPQIIQSMQVEVQLPGGITTALPMLANGNAYKAVFQNTEELGTYELRFSGTTQEDTFSARQSVRVVSAPWVRFIDPQPGNTYSVSLAIPVRVQLMFGTQVLESPESGDQLETTVQLVNADGQESEMQFLQPVGSGIYSGMVSTGTAGRYIMRAQLRYVPTSGERFEDVTETALQVLDMAQVNQQRSATLVPTPTRSPTAELQRDAQQVVVMNDFTPIYIAMAGLGSVILLSQLLLAGILRNLRLSYQKADPLQDSVLHQQPGFDAGLQELVRHGWQDLAAQAVADALQETIAIDATAGILDATSDPCPKFTLSTCDGREVMFATDLPMLRRLRLVRRGDRVIDVSALSQTRHVDAGMLWRYAMAERGQTNVAVPSMAHWFVVVRQPGAKSAGLRTATRRNLLQRLFRPRPGGR